MKANAVLKSINRSRSSNPSLMVVNKFLNSVVGGVGVNLYRIKPESAFNLKSIAAVSSRDIKHPVWINILSFVAIQYF
jgi:hypothetical protein